MAQIELSEKEYVEFKEYKKSLKENRMKEIPSLINDLDEKVKIDKDKLREEKKVLDSEVKDLTKEIKVLKKNLKDDDKTNETNQSDIQEKFENK